MSFSRAFNIYNCKNLIDSKRSINSEYRKIAIIGSRHYQHKEKVREMIYLLKKRFDKVQIVSGGAIGVDSFAKKYALELGVGYVEFNPAHTGRNLYSMMPDEYYGHPYHVSHLFHRNELIVLYADEVIAFRANGKSSGTDNAIKLAEKHNKPCIIVGDRV